MEISTVEISKELAKHGLKNTLFSQRQSFKIGAEYAWRQAFKAIEARFPRLVFRMKATMSMEEWQEFSGQK